MKRIKIFMLLLIGLFSINLSAQSDEAVEPQATLGFSNEESALNFFSEQAQIVSPSTSANGHLVYINQAGNHNVVSSNVTSEKSDLRVRQDGDGNFAFFGIVAGTVNQTLIQEGNSNNFFNFTHAPDTEHNAEVLQKGNQTDVTIYGGNSLSQDMRINVEGNDRSVIIRNF